MVTNHQSFLDPWLVGIAPSRQIHYMARDTLFKGGFTQWLLELWNSYPVKRGAADLNAIRITVERLERGFVVNVFPEGTRSEDGTIGGVAAGVGLIVNRCKAPVTIVPVVIEGAFEAWPKGQKAPHPSPIRIVHGAPISSEEVKGLGGEEVAMRVRGELVKLQERIGSAHAAGSRARYEADVAAMKEKKPRRRGRE